MLMGAVTLAAADLLGSTSASVAAAGFPGGFWNAAARPEARLVSTGGICEDGMSGILAGLSSFGRHVGVGASYGAFLAPLGHVASRLHAIGAQARHGEPFRPMILVCAHAGLKTGEDGPTHADPQPLQLLQENFPPGTLITLTPWEPQEIWPLLAAALARRPAVIAPFVTRPSETVLDRPRLGLTPASLAGQGVYALLRPNGHPDGTLILQESAAAYAFVLGALPRLARDGVRLLVYYVASAELFDLLSPAERLAILRGADTIVQEEIRAVPACPSGVDARQLPPDCHESAETRSALEIAAPAREIDTGEHRLGVADRGKMHGERRRRGPATGRTLCRSWDQRVERSCQTRPWPGSCRRAKTPVPTVPQPGICSLAYPGPTVVHHRRRSWPGPSHWAQRPGRSLPSHVLPATRAAS